MKLRRILASVIAGACVFGASAEVKYVFYLIGDGMGMGHVNAAQYYNRMVRGADEPILMMQFPVASQAWTYSASSPVTDSAAAGTALSTGNKTYNNMLGMAPDSVTHYVSIARELKDAGWGVGVLTSVAPDDATPGRFTPISLRAICITPLIRRLSLPATIFLEDVLFVVRRVKMVSLTKCPQ